MNLVFDKKTLKVVSLFDNTFREPDEEILKAMFPYSFKEMAIWKIDYKVYHNPTVLSVKLDKNDDPEKLVLGNKIIYKRTNAEKEKLDKGKISRKREDLEGKITKSLLRSIGRETINIWIKSVHTKPKIAKSLINFQYFWDKEIMPVSWWGPFTDAGGYANMNREIVFRLHNHHIIPNVNICPTAPQISQTNQYRLSKYTALNLSRVKKYPKIWSFTPLPHPSNLGKNIFFTMMETESLHPEFVRLCNSYSDEVWVPSNHNKNVFQQYGVKRPINVIPLGIDETMYSKEENPTLGYIRDKSQFISLLGQDPNKRINSFKFLTLFGWSYRKGIDILIRSFVKEFNKSDDVALVIVSRHSGSAAEDHVNVIREDVKKYAKTIRSSNHPQIILYPGIVPEKEMPSIYRMGNAFVHLSRGEGFSLPQIEASACGLPVISCNNTGMSQYLTDENAYLVKTDEKEIASPEMHWITSYYQNQLFAKLGNDQIDQARSHMRFVLNNYKEAVVKGKSLQDLVFDKYTWRKTAETVANRIEEIYEEY